MTKIVLAPNRLNFLWISTKWNFDLVDFRRKLTQCQFCYYLFASKQFVDIRRVRYCHRNSRFNSQFRLCFEAEVTVFQMFRERGRCPFEFRIHFAADLIFLSKLRLFGLTFECSKIDCRYNKIRLMCESVRKGPADSVCFGGWHPSNSTEMTHKHLIHLSTIFTTKLHPFSKSSRRENASERN